MKKTFKVKNILNNKKKYNFKSELLLSSLVVLLAFSNVSCKKDPVSPVNKEEPVKPDFKADSTAKAKNIKKFTDTVLLQTKEIYDIFWMNAVFAPEAKSFLDSVKGTSNEENTAGRGYVTTVKDIKESNEGNLTPQETAVLDSIMASSKRYLELVESNNNSKSR